jgi:PiT family inorganic phosphate transporter
MLFANLYGVPVSTSMTAVGAIAGLGLVTGQLDFAVLGSVMVWWVIAPIVGFWFGAVIDRYFYTYLDQTFALQQSSGPLLTLDRSGIVPRPDQAPEPPLVKQSVLLWYLPSAVTCHLVLV